MCEFACELCDERPGGMQPTRHHPRLESHELQLDHAEQPRQHHRMQGHVPCVRGLWHACAAERQLQAGDMARGILEEGLSKARRKAGSCSSPRAFSTSRILKEGIMSPLLERRAEALPPAGVRRQELVVPTVESSEGPQL